MSLSQVCVCVCTCAYVYVHVYMTQTYRGEPSCRSVGMYSRSHLGLHFGMLFQSSKLKARTSLFSETWQKRRSSFEVWAFENVTPSGIGCTHILQICWHVWKPLVCISVVIDLLAVWRHNKPKTKKPKTKCTHTFCRSVDMCENQKHEYACIHAGIYVYIYAHIYTSDSSSTSASVWMHDTHITLAHAHTHNTTHTHTKHKHNHTHTRAV